MVEAKQKAKEMTEAMFNLLPWCLHEDDVKRNREISKRCATIAVIEIKKEIIKNGFASVHDNEYKFWIEVSHYISNPDLDTIIWNIYPPT